MKQLILGLILFGLLCFGVGCLTGIVYENLSLNYKVNEKLTGAANSNGTTLIKVDSRYFVLSEITQLSEVKNDSTIGTPRYPIK